MTRIFLFLKNALRIVKNRFDPEENIYVFFLLKKKEKLNRKIEGYMK